MYSKTNFKRVALIAILPVLAACASSGGMPYAELANVSENPKPDADGNLPTVLKPITPQLVKEERALRDKQLSQDIGKLMGEGKAYQIESGDVLSIVVWDHPELAGA